MVLELPHIGFLNINKPKGLTSHDVVNSVRKITGTKKVGHAGTLDPIAQGVLVVGIGKATRLLEYVSADQKIYNAVGRLGMASDTYDLDGTATEIAAVPQDLTLAKLEVVCEEFIGILDQLPPPYSAIKIQGRPAYEYARRGITIKLAARNVTIYSIQVTSFDSPEFSFTVRCSSGTYVRSLIHDIGKRIGCGAVMCDLVRTASGAFEIAESVTLEDLRQFAQPDRLNDILIPIRVALPHFQTIRLTDQQLVDIYHGRNVSVDTSLEGLAIGCTMGGHTVAILENSRNDNTVHPIKLLVDQPIYSNTPVEAN